MIEWKKYDRKIPLLYDVDYLVTDGVIVDVAAKSSFTRDDNTMFQFYEGSTLDNDDVTHYAEINLHK